MADTLNTLLELTRSLGQPHLHYVIIGEGNTSMRVDDDTFYVKASGQGMHQIQPDGFVAMRFAPILGLLETPELDAPSQKAVIREARVDSHLPMMPSIEVTFHAQLLAECHARFIGHTHPVAVNRILCSNRARQFAQNRIFPDEAVLCGVESVFVEYTDPGLPLALAIREQVRQFMQDYGEAPKVILLANHGLIVLGQTPAEVLNITAMCVKAADIFAGACAVGEPVFMARADVLHICNRPDEIYRRQQFVERG